MKKIMLKRLVLLSVVILFLVPNTGQGRKRFKKGGYQKKVKIIGGIKFVLIRGGSFQMGSAKRRGYFSERPMHKVKVSSFWMGKFEVTQKQYKKIMGSNPSSFKGRNNPVEQVSYYDALEFCKKFSTRYGVNVRLPREAEWEYACRAGKKGAYYWGKKINDRYCWYNLNSRDETRPVGKKRPNRWGLYDMSGNVYEWCGDWYDDHYYKTSQADNPVGPEKGKSKVIRGGSWSSNKYNLRSAFRTPFNPSKKNFYIGFRLVLPIN
ncbi:formylglycine-generating enzyme family protein [Spirochaetota bacterium]